MSQQAMSPFDLSWPALRSIHHGRRVQGDAEWLPFATGSFAYIFSVAALEHVPDPGRAFEEIARVLTPGGVAYLARAWNCRKWTARGVTVLPYSQLSLRDKITKGSLPLREHILWRALWVALFRLWREMRRPSRLAYLRLTPNLDRYLTSDSDAYASIDPHAAVLFFRSRGFEVLSHPGFKRMLARHEPVVLRKPRA